MNPRTRTRRQKRRDPAASARLNGTFIKADPSAPPGVVYYSNVNDAAEFTDAKWIEDADFRRAVYSLQSDVFRAQQRIAALENRLDKLETLLAPRLVPNDDGGIEL